MKKNTYFPDADIMSRVCIEFLESRPQIKVMILTFNLLTLFLASIIFIILQTEGRITNQSIVFLIATYLWLSHRKFFQRILIKYRFNKSIKKHNKSWKFTFNKFKITANVNDTTWDMKWKSFRKIFYLKKLSGYMIPLTGFTNSGRFIWLPESGFESEAALQEFQEFIAYNNLKIRTMK
jgi:hypothetical protein